MATSLDRALAADTLRHNEDMSAMGSSLRSLRPPPPESSALSAFSVVKDTLDLTTAEHEEASGCGVRGRHLARQLMPEPL